MAVTKLADLINPEVMAPMISAKIENAIVVTPFAKIDNTLVGTPGNTITVPRYDYIGDAEDVAEGEAVPQKKLTTDSTPYTVKKAANSVPLTDEAVLSGLGNPVGEANGQLAKSIASKIDGDAIEALNDATHTYDGSSSQISYEGIVDAIDVFEEEFNTEKVIFVNPKQVTTLRKDSNFISADKYPGNVIMSGEIGKICNCRVVSTRRVATEDGTAGSVEITIGGTVASGDKFAIDGFEVTAASTTKADVATALAAAINNATTGSKIYSAEASSAKVTLTEKTGQYGRGLKNGVTVTKTSDAGTITEDKTGYAGTCEYACPIVKLEQDDRTEDEVPALTIYKKRDLNVETDRDVEHKQTLVSVDQHYVAALTNAAKVVLATFKA